MHFHSATAPAAVQPDDTAQDLRPLDDIQEGLTERAWTQVPDATTGWRGADVDGSSSEMEEVEEELCDKYGIPYLDNWYNLASHAARAWADASSRAGSAAGGEIPRKRVMQRRRTKRRRARDVGQAITTAYKGLKQKAKDIFEHRRRSSLEAEDLVHVTEPRSPRRTASEQKPKRGSGTAKRPLGGDNSSSDDLRFALKIGSHKLRLPFLGSHSSSEADLQAAEAGFVQTQEERAAAAMAEDAALGQWGSSGAYLPPGTFHERQQLRRRARQDKVEGAPPTDATSVHVHGVSVDTALGSMTSSGDQNALRTPLAPTPQMHGSQRLNNGYGAVATTGSSRSILSNPGEGPQVVADTHQPGRDRHESTDWTRDAEAEVSPGGMTADSRRQLLSGAVAVREPSVPGGGGGGGGGGAGRRRLSTEDDLHLHSDIYEGLTDFEEEYRRDQRESQARRAQQYPDSDSMESVTSSSSSSEAGAVDAAELPAFRRLTKATARKSKARIATTSTAIHRSTTAESSALSVVFREPWAEKQSRLAAESIYSHLPGMHTHCPL